MSYAAKQILMILSFLTCGFFNLKMPNEKVLLKTEDGEVSLRVLRLKPHQMRGFQLVEKLPPHEGLLYLVAHFERKPNFWMKGVAQPLDIVFLSKHGDVIDVVRANPNQEGRIKSPQNTNYAIELPAGEAQKLKIFKGSNVLASLVVNL